MSNENEEFGEQSESDENEAASVEPEALDSEALATLVGQFETSRLDPGAEPETVRLLEARVEAVKDALREQVVKDRVMDTLRVMRGQEAILRMPDRYGSRLSEEDVAREMASFRADVEATAESQAGSDVLMDSPIWQEAMTARFHRARAIALADDETRPTWDDVVAEAQESVNETYARVLADA